jgi:hypothetical protein
MFGWFKKQPKSSLATEQIASQPPGEIFPWPKGWKLTALDEVVLLVPAQILSEDEPIVSVIHCEDDVRLSLPTVPPDSPDALNLIWLRVGQSVWLTKSCQAMVVPDNEQDKALRRFRLSQVTENSG